MKILNHEQILKDIQEDIAQVQTCKIKYLLLAIFFGICINCKNQLNVLTLIITFATIAILYLLIYNFALNSYKKNYKKIKENNFYIQKVKLIDIQHYKTSGKHKRSYQKMIFSNYDDLKLTEDFTSREKLNQFCIGQTYYMVYIPYGKKDKLIKYYNTDLYQLDCNQNFINEKLYGKNLN